MTSFNQEVTRRHTEIAETRTTSTAGEVKEVIRDLPKSTGDTTGGVIKKVPKSEDECSLSCAHEDAPLLDSVVKQESKLFRLEYDIRSEGAEEPGQAQGEAIPLYVGVNSATNTPMFMMVRTLKGTNRVVPVMGPDGPQVLPITSLSTAHFNSSISAALTGSQNSLTSSNIQPTSSNKSKVESAAANVDNRTSADLETSELRMIDSPKQQCTSKASETGGGSRTCMSERDDTQRREDYQTAESNAASQQRWVPVREHRKAAEPHEYDLLKSEIKCDTTQHRLQHKLRHGESESYRKQEFIIASPTEEKKAPSTGQENRAVGVVEAQRAVVGMHEHTAQQYHSRNISHQGNTASSDEMIAGVGNSCEAAQITRPQKQLSTFGECEEGERILAAQEKEKLKQLLKETSWMRHSVVQQRNYSEQNQAGNVLCSDNSNTGTAGLFHPTIRIPTSSYSYENAGRSYRPSAGSSEAQPFNQSCSVSEEHNNLGSITQDEDISSGFARSVRRCFSDNVSSYGTVPKLRKLCQSPPPGFQLPNDARRHAVTSPSQQQANVPSHIEAEFHQQMLLEPKIPVEGGMSHHDKVAKMGCSDVLIDTERKSEMPPNAAAEMWGRLGEFQSEVNSTSEHQMSVSTSEHQMSVSTSEHHMGVECAEADCSGRDVQPHLSPQSQFSPSQVHYSPPVSHGSVPSAGSLSLPNRKDDFENKLAAEIRAVMAQSPASNSSESNMSGLGRRISAADSIRSNLSPCSAMEENMSAYDEGIRFMISLERLLEENSKSVTSGCRQTLIDHISDIMLTAKKQILFTKREELADKIAAVVNCKKVRLARFRMENILTVWYCI